MPLGLVFLMWSEYLPAKARLSSKDRIDPSSMAVHRDGSRSPSAPPSKSSQKSKSSAHVTLGKLMSGLGLLSTGLRSTAAAVSFRVSFDEAAASGAASLPAPTEASSGSSAPEERTAPGLIEATQWQSKGSSTSARRVSRPDESM